VTRQTRLTSYFFFGFKKKERENGLMGNCQIGGNDLKGEKLKTKDSKLKRIKTVKTQTNIYIYS
jgi:hypothetical protein